MKKTILTIVTFISLLLTTALVSASYNFTAKDKQLINALTQKVEQVISEKGEKFRTPLVEGINKLSLQYKKNTRVSNILGKVALNIEKSEKQVSFIVEELGYQKKLIIIKNGKRIEVDKVDGDLKNIQVVNNFLIYDWISTGGSIKKIFDILNEKELFSKRGGKMTNDNKFLYACNIQGNGPGNVGVIQLEKGREFNYNYDTYSSYIEKCHYVFEKGNHFIYFKEGGLEKIFDFQSFQLQNQK